MMQYDELDSVTREWMLKEFRIEQEETNPYRSKEMTGLGKSKFTEIIEEAILEGNEVSLAADLVNTKFWQPYTNYSVKGKIRKRKVNPLDSSKRFALTEFNTWYVRGLCRKLMEEGVESCEVYRAAYASEPRPDCQDHDGKTFKVLDVYKGHRARYWPIVNKTAFSIPIGPNCHHTIRRLKIR